MADTRVISTRAGDRLVSYRQVADETGLDLRAVGRIYGALKPAPVSCQFIRIPSTTAVRACIVPRLWVPARIVTTTVPLNDPLLTQPRAGTHAVPAQKSGLTLNHGSGFIVEAQK